MNRILTSLLIPLVINTICVAQITRGHSVGELYISSRWYFDGVNNSYFAIIHSLDNGQSVSINYFTTTTPPIGEMGIYTVLGDYNNGTVYNYGNTELWVSYDYGVSWNYVESYGSSGRFTSGFAEGEIYKCCVNPQGTIWRSIDYGNNFIEIRDDAKFHLEVGVKEGELYGISGYTPEGFTIHYSENNGISFDDFPVDSSVAYYAFSGKYPQISRGANPNELYLASWW